MINLSPRQAEIFRRRALGQSYIEISNALQLSTYTIKQHIHDIYLRTGAQSSADLALLALRHEVVSAADYDARLEAMRRRVMEGVS